MKSVRGVVGSLTSFILSPSKDAGQGRLQVTCLLLMISMAFFVVASFPCMTGHLDCCGGAWIHKLLVLFEVKFSNDDNN